MAGALHMSLGIGDTCSIRGEVPQRVASAILYMLCVAYLATWGARWLTAPATLGDLRPIEDESLGARPQAAPGDPQRPPDKACYPTLKQGRNGNQGEPNVHIQAEVSIADIFFA